MSLVFVLVLGCLPAETREEPGVLELSVRTAPSSLDPSGIVSDDGWTLYLDRYLVGLGNAELEGDDCQAYSEGGYGRILDMNRTEPQPLSVTFGLGRCDLTLQLSGPRWDSVLGAGVAPEVGVLLTLPGTDTVRDDSPVSVYIEGRASRGNVVKRFAWPFRAEITYESCRTDDADGTPVPLTLRTGQRRPLELVLDADALFEDDSQVLFAPFAAADDAGDSDGTVTLPELAARSTLFEAVYFSRLPALVTLPNGTCAPHVNPKEND